MSIIKLGNSRRYIIITLPIENPAEGLNNSEIRRCGVWMASCKVYVLQEYYYLYLFVREQKL